MSRTAVLFALILLAVVSGVAFAGAVAPRLVPRAVNPPTLDGRLDDWPAMPLLLLASGADWNSSALEYGGPEDVSAELRLAWDAQALYVVIKVRDDKLVRVPSPNEIDRAGDSVVFGIAAEGAKEPNEFAITLLSTGSPRVYRSEPASQAREMKALNCVVDPRADEGGGWRVVYELALPWSELYGLRPLAGERVKVTIAASDDDGEGLKGFLEHSATVVLANSQSPVAGELGMPRPQPMVSENRSFTVRGGEVLLFGGEIGYTGLSRAQWAHRLACAKAAGMNVIGVSVPWSYHQPTPDHRELGDLRAFLEAVGKAGLWAQVNVGPFADEARECGGLPAWYFGLDGIGRTRAADEWLSALLAVVKDFQISSGGPVLSVLARAVPEANGWTGTASLSHLVTGVRATGMRVPLLTANAPAAPMLAGLLDSIRFYEAPSYADLGEALLRLSQSQNGPAVISALPGSYATEPGARRSADAIRVALARGARAVMVSDFAPGLDRTAASRPADPPAGGVLESADRTTPGYGELRLLGDLIRLCGPQLARALPAEFGTLRCDDDQVHATARLTEKTGFIFLWNETGRTRHQVRLTYNEPGTATVTSIPASGAIEIPAGGAKILPLDLPVGRGTLRYSTSEVAGLHRLGDRLLLVIYGDPDTPGEVSLRWPGKPLVLGDVVSNEWDPARKVLTLDYFHKTQDQYLMVDNLLIAVLSRARAATAAPIGAEAILIPSTGVETSDGAVLPERAEFVAQAPEGDLQITAALPAAPSQVMVDGKPAAFNYLTPSRVLEMKVTTGSFEQEREPSSVWRRISRSVVGGPPKLAAAFDRAAFLADAEAPESTWTQVGTLGRAPEALGLRSGQFARLRTRIVPAGRTTLALVGAADPMLVCVNGRRVSFAADTPNREAEVASLLTEGENEISLLVYVQPRAPGLAGLRQPEKRLPLVVLKGEAGELTPDRWEMSPGLAGEAAGWPALKSSSEPWTVLRLGPWREQGRRYEDLTGAGWYRVVFGLAQRDGWQIPYQAHVTVSGYAQLFINGEKLATLLGSGTYTVPLPDSFLVHGGDNVLAAAIFDPAGSGGLGKVEITSDESRMARARHVEITF